MTTAMCNPMRTRTYGRMTKKVVVQIGRNQWKDGSIGEELRDFCRFNVYWLESTNQYIKLWFLPRNLNLCKVRSKCNFFLWKKNSLIAMSKTKLIERTDVRLSHIRITASHAVLRITKFCEIKLLDRFTRMSWDFWPRICVLYNFGSASLFVYLWANDLLVSQFAFNNKFWDLLRKPLILFK